MSRAPQIPDHVWPLLSQLTDGTLDDSGYTELEAWLIDQPAHQDALLAFCQLHTELAFSQAADHAIEALREIAGEKQAADGGSASDREEAHNSTAHHPTLTAQKAPRSSRSRRNLAVGLVAGFAAIAAVLTWAAFTYLPGIANQTPDDEPVEGAKHVAVLYSHKDVEWVDQTRAASNQTRLVPGERLAIRSGLIEIAYHTGARVVIEGPAEYYVGLMKDEDAKTKHRVSKTSSHPSSFILDPSNSGYLALGRLVARCETPESKGFTIATPAARVEDLGTEFAVAVADDQRTQVHVVAGKVRFASNSGDVPPVVLRAGQSASADTGAPPRIEPLPSKLAQEIDNIRRRLTRIEAFEAIPAKLPYAPLADDLVAGLTPTSSITPGASLAGLTDGQTTPRLGSGPDGRVFADAHEPWVLTFDLAQSVPEDAREVSRWFIHEVRVFSYNTDARVFQDYDVEVSADGQTWDTIEQNIRNGRRGREINLPSGVPPDYYHDYSVTRLAQRDGGPMTEASRYVRLRFYGTAKRNGLKTFSRMPGAIHSSLYEIDVLGNPAQQEEQPAGGAAPGDAAAPEESASTRTPPDAKKASARIARSGKVKN